MRFKRYFLALMMVAFHALALTAGEVWTAKNVPIPFLRDSTQYVSDPDGYVDKALKDSANSSETEVGVWRTECAHHCGKG